MTEQNDANKYKGLPLLHSLSILVKEVGLIGFVTVLFAFVFLTFSTIEQKQEFIDRFILLKPAQYNLNCYLVLLFLIVIIVLGFIYYKSILKLKKGEIKRLGEEKERLQSLHLNKPN